MFLDVPGPIRQLSSVPRSRHYYCYYYCRSADCSHSPTTTNDSYISRFHPLRSGVTDGSHGEPCERDAPPSRAALAVSHERQQASCSHQDPWIFIPCPYRGFGGPRDTKSPSPAPPLLLQSPFNNCIPCNRSQGTPVSTIPVGLKGGNIGRRRQNDWSAVQI